MSRRFCLVLSALAYIAISGSVFAQAQCPAPNINYGPGASAHYGNPVAVGNGYARSIVVTRANGTPLTIGFMLTDTALTGLPATEPEYEYILPMPQGVSVPPYTILALNWEVHGHEPANVYGVPHFDFHFYMLTAAERAGITATGADLARVEKRPDAKYIPQGYQHTPGGVPHMGAHWIDPRSPEFNGKPFTKTFIYGFYNGKMAFLESMATIAYLKTMPVATDTIPQPQAVQRTGYYPQSYTIAYDQANKIYTVSLGDLVSRQAQ
jgi:hypothetical protein